MAYGCEICAAPAVKGTLRCQKHMIAKLISTVKRKRPASSRTKRKYTPKRNKHWNKISFAYLAKNPYCVLCERANIKKLASHVDHIIPIRWAPDKEMDKNNWQSLCQRCHGIKTKFETYAKKAYNFKTGEVFTNNEYNKLTK